MADESADEEPFPNPLTRLVVSTELDAVRQQVERLSDDDIAVLKWRIDKDRAEYERG